MPRERAIPISYTKVSFRNLLSMKPPNTITFDLLILTAVCPLQESDSKEKFISNKRRRMMTD